MRSISGAFRSHSNYEISSVLQKRRRSSVPLTSNKIRNQSLFTQNLDSENKVCCESRFKFKDLEHCLLSQSLELPYKNRHFEKFTYQNLNQPISNTLNEHQCSESICKTKHWNNICNCPCASTMSTNLEFPEGDFGIHQGSNFSHRVVLNVGGARHEVLLETLMRFPFTRLGKIGQIWKEYLSHTSSSEEDLKRKTLDVRQKLIKEKLCDDIDQKRGDIYFDRHPYSFTAIINFYRTGKLHMADDFCVMNFGEELEYWGIDEVFWPILISQDTYN